MRCGCIGSFNPSGAMPTAARNVLRLQDAWGWSQVKSLAYARLLMTELSITELSRPSHLIWWSRLSSPVDDIISGKVLLTMGGGDSKRPWQVVDFCSN